MVFAFAALAGCAPSLAVDDRQKTEIEAYISAEFDYRAPLKFGDIWMADAATETDLACGEFAAPPEFNGSPASLRFVYNLHYHNGDVEMHRLWVTESASGQTIMGLNRTVFDKLWSEFCEDFRPSAIRQTVGL